jgi:hypothetical protein
MCGYWLSDWSVTWPSLKFMKINKKSLHFIPPCCLIYATVLPEMIYNFLHWKFTMYYLLPIFFYIRSNRWNKKWILGVFNLNLWWHLSRIYVPKCWLAWVFNSRINSLLFLVLNLSIFGSKSRSIFSGFEVCSFKTRKSIKDQPWVETQVNSVFGHINVTFAICITLIYYFPIFIAHMLAWRSLSSL